MRKMAEMSRIATGVNAWREFSGARARFDIP
jgi:hypothetical protein